jgi:transposase-like protein
MFRQRVRRYKKDITPEIINKCLNSNSLFEVSQRSGVNKSTIRYRQEKLALSDMPVKNLTYDQMALLLRPKELNQRKKRINVTSEMIDAYKNGQSAQEVSDEFGVSASTLTRRFRELGVIRIYKDACKLAHQAGKHSAVRQASL